MIFKRHMVFLLSLTLLLACHRSTVSPGSGAAGFRIVDPTPSEGELTRVLEREATRAQAAGLRPYLEVSAVWCAPCRRLKQALVDPRIQEAFRGAYLVRLDFDAWEKQFPTIGIDVKGIPVFYELSPNGRPTERRIDGEAWSDDTPESMAPVLKRFFTPG